jgi:hypothetical protein
MQRNIAPQATVRSGTKPPLSIFSLGAESSIDPALRDQLRILSLPTGQELAPWHWGLVAVASSGLFPQPLWISAAG